MKIYVNGVMVGECGDYTGLKDRNGRELFIGDQVILIGFNQYDYYDEMFGLSVVVNEYCDRDRKVNGLKGVNIINLKSFNDDYNDDGYDGYVSIYKVKDFSQCVDNECINKLSVRYVE